MKPLNDYIHERYINEKLKLGDINRDNIDGRWVDVNKLKFDDLKEGNIVELNNGDRFIIINGTLGKSIFTANNIEKEDKLLISSDPGTRSGFFYIRLNNWKAVFPKYANNGTVFPDKLSIKRVYIKEKVYTNVKDLRIALENIKNNEI